MRIAIKISGDVTFSGTYTSNKLYSFGQISIKGGYFITKTSKVVKSRAKARVGFIVGNVNKKKVISE